MSGVENIDIVSDLTEGYDDTTVQPNVPEPVKAPKVEIKTDERKEPVQPTSLRDQISNAIKGEPDTPPAASQDGRPRTADGKFAPASDASTPAAPVDGQSAGGEAVVAPVNPPAGIDPIVFNALPAETQSYIARTMESVAEQAERYAGYAQLEQLIAPRRQPWALNGMTEVQAVNQLLALSDFAGQDPTGFIQYFAKASNIDLEDIVFAADEDDTDPTVKALRAELEQIKGTLAQGQNTQQQQAHEERVRSVATFFDAKDESGNALRPYATELGDNILPHIQHLRSTNPSWTQEQVLQEAYDRACWATPSVRQKLQATANTAATADQVRTQQERAARARQAGASVASGVPASPPAPTSSGNGSLRDTIRDSIAQFSE